MQELFSFRADHPETQAPIGLRAFLVLLVALAPRPGVKAVSAMLVLCLKTPAHLLFQSARPRKTFQFRQPGRGDPAPGLCLFGVAFLIRPETEQPNDPLQREPLN